VDFPVDDMSLNIVNKPLRFLVSMFALGCYACFVVVFNEMKLGLLASSHLLLFLLLFLFGGMFF
jgi:hypothetical protein